MYRKVLVPLDGSQLAECALSHVKKMAREGCVGEIIFLHVVDIHPLALIEGFDITTIQKSNFDCSRSYLDQLQAQFRKEGIEVKTELLKGSAAQEIAEYANQEGVDLIVIATHGYTGMKRLMFGSVALMVLHDSHVPVLLIRPDPCRP
jgi:nucleotide-binding universal stress UspA family protein